MKINVSNYGHASGTLAEQLRALVFIEYLATQSACYNTDIVIMLHIITLY